MIMIGLHPRMPSRATLSAHTASPPPPSRTPAGSRIPSLSRLPKTCLSCAK